MAGKSFSERLFKAFERNYGLNVRIGSSIIFLVQKVHDGGKEKAPAACVEKQQNVRTAIV